MKRFSSIFSYSAILVLVGCAHSKFLDPHSENKEVSPLMRDIALEPRAQSLVASQDANGVPLRREIVVAGVKLKNTEFDYPVAINSRVEHWVEYFTGRGRKTFEKWLVRSEYFVPYIKPILRENGLPEDLVYQAMIESGFNNHARSHARAVGPWQFISGTGERYGLAINWWVDERHDIQKSTVAAVAYMKRLFEIFNSWELASAAYNAGEAKILQAVKRYGTTDFWTLSNQRYLKSETRNYVPKIIAAALVAKNREAFGFKDSYREDQLQLSSEEAEDVVPASYSQEEIEEENEVQAYPSLADYPLDFIGPVIPEDHLHVDDKFALVVDPLYPSSEAQEKSDGFEVVARGPSQDTQYLVPHVSRQGQVAGESIMEFEVKSPADLAKIAKAAGISYDAVKALNPEIKRWCTPPTSKSYRIKLPADRKGHFLANYNDPDFSRDIDFQVYKVKQGDTLSQISKRFGIGYEPLEDLNGIRKNTTLQQGQQVVLPLPNDQRSWYSLGITSRPNKKARGARLRPRNRSSQHGQSTQYEKLSFEKRVKARRRL